MLDGFSTNATVAKARAMYGKRLMPEDYRELLHRTTVAEAADYLKRNTHYRAVLAAVDTAKVHRGFLEELLRRHIFDLYLELCHFQRLEKTDFYRYQIVKREVQEIVSCLRYLNADMMEEYRATIPVYLAKRSSFDVMALGNVKGFPDLLEVLEGTPYQDIIKEFNPDSSGKYDCTLMETALRTYYQKWLEESIDKGFYGKTQKTMHTLVRNQADLINIINSFRLKSFFGDSPEEIEEKLLPLYGRLSRKKRMELFEAADADEYIARLRKTYYGRQLEQVDPKLRREFLENSAQALRAKYSKLNLRASNSAPVSLYTILSLFDVEVENLINIIEGIRYQASPEMIQKLLIL